jgi:hypothetical protein
MSLLTNVGRTGEREIKIESLMAQSRQIVG